MFLIPIKNVLNRHKSYYFLLRSDLMSISVRGECIYKGGACDCGVAVGGYGGCLRATPP